MEELTGFQSTPATALKDHSTVRWRDLRDWLALIDDNGRLLRINQPVDPEQELAAITFMATRRENAPALLFETLDGDRFGARVLANMLGSSRERYALAVGLDPDLSIAEMIAATRNIMRRRIAPVRVPAATGRSTKSFCGKMRSTSPHFRCRNSGRATVDATSAPATSR
jgi:hypothetical protein